MNQVICRIIYWFFGLSYFFIIPYPGIATSGGTVWWMGRPDLCGDRGGGLPKNVVYIRHSKAAGIKYIQWHVDLCLIRSVFSGNIHCDIPNETQHVLSTRTIRGSLWGHYLQLSTGWKASVLGAKIHKDLWFGCSQSSRWHSLNPHTDSVKALFSLLVDFGIDPLWSLLCTTGQDTSKNC